MLSFRISRLLSGNSSCNTVFLFEELLRVFNENSATKGSRALLRVSLVSYGNLILMDKVQVQSEEQEVERKEVRDFTDTSFHNTGFIGFSNFARLDDWSDKDKVVSPD